MRPWHRWTSAPATPLEGSKGTSGCSLNSDRRFFFSGGSSFFVSFLEGHVIFIFSFSEDHPYFFSFFLSFFGRPFFLRRPSQRTDPLHLSFERWAFPISTLNINGSGLVFQLPTSAIYFSKRTPGAIAPVEPVPSRLPSCQRWRAHGVKGGPFT